MPYEEPEPDRYMIRLTGKIVDLMTKIEYLTELRWITSKGKTEEDRIEVGLLDAQIEMLEDILGGLLAGFERELRDE